MALHWRQTARSGRLFAGQPSLLQVPEPECASATKCLSEQDACEAHHGQATIPILGLGSENASRECLLAGVTPAQQDMLMKKFENLIKSSRTSTMLPCLVHENRNNVVQEAVH